MMNELPWQHVGEASILSQKRCQRLYAISGRGKLDDLVLLYARDRFFAMEAWCSHAEGPLFEGDIEDFKGRPHIMCPWHGYMFDAETGLNDIGIMQETFETKTEDGQLYVKYKYELKTTAPKDI